MTEGPADAAALWAERESPSLADFEALAALAFSTLPESFKALCGDVVIRVADFPDEDVLEDLGLESEFDLLGLFQGIGLAQSGAAPETGRLPNRIWLYRRPILDYWAENSDPLGALVAHVLIHEIGHHVGLSDDDMDRIEQAIG